MWSGLTHPPCPGEETKATEPLAGARVRDPGAVPAGSAWWACVHACRCECVYVRMCVSACVDARGCECVCVCACAQGHVGAHACVYTGELLE